MSAGMRNIWSGILDWPFSVFKSLLVFLTHLRYFFLLYMVGITIRVFCCFQGLSNMETFEFTLLQFCSAKAHLIFLRGASCNQRFASSSQLAEYAQHKISLPLYFSTLRLIFIILTPDYPLLMCTIYVEVARVIIKYTYHLFTQ